MEKPVIKQHVKAFILEAFLYGEDPDALTDTTPLITGGILGSIATIKLIGFLEDQFGIDVQPHEMNEDYLDTLEEIATLIQVRMPPA